jgi:phosphatidate cytidylyltransferase
MRTRIITAAVAIPLLLLLLLVADKMIAAIIWGALLSVATYELLYTTGLVREPRLVIYACISSFAMTMWSYFEAIHAFGILLVIVYMSILFAEMMHAHVTITFDKIGMCVMGGLVIPFLLSSLIRILSMNIGRFVILIPFIVAFSSDAGAYFAGYFFGKHKLAPVLSQHKTVEGAIGGVVAAVLAMILYAAIMDLPFKPLNFRVNYLYAIIYGLTGSLVGIFGDLCFSVIKRQTGIKDYGKILPGHGGILDRFDSMMMVGPLVEVLLLLIPVIS